MGYGMYVINQPERLKQIEAELWNDTEPPSPERRQELYKEKWALEEETGSCFRLNIWGMGEYCNVMEQIGMLEWEESVPPFPDSADYDIPQLEVAYNGETYHEDDEDSPEYAAYKRALDAKLAYGTVGVIPGHKFCSNDGWIVTPKECANALDAYRRYVDSGGDVAELLNDGDVKYWQQWLIFLATAAEGGGFTVN